MEHFAAAGIAHVHCAGHHCMMQLPTHTRERMCPGGSMTGAECGEGTQARVLITQ